LKKKPSLSINLAEMKNHLMFGNKDVSLKTALTTESPPPKKPKQRATSPGSF
jgi:hypothetical protein